MENQAIVIKICEVINFLIIQLFKKLDNDKGDVLRGTHPLLRIPPLPLVRSRENHGQENKKFYKPESWRIETLGFLGKNLFEKPP